MPIVETRLRDGAWDWSKIVTPEHPRKCTTCQVVYPPDHPDAPPLTSEMVCHPCFRVAVTFDLRTVRQ